MNAVSPGFRATSLGLDNSLRSWMLLFLPLSFAAKVLGCDPMLVFIISPTGGGLLNATFGNATTATQEEP